MAMVDHFCEKPFKTHFLFKKILICRDKSADSLKRKIGCFHMIPPSPYVSKVLARKNLFTDFANGLKYLQIGS